MHGPNSIHNVPPQLDLPAHGNWQKQQRKRKPPAPVQEASEPTAQQPPEDDRPLENGQTAPVNRELGSQIDIEA